MLFTNQTDGENFHLLEKAVSRLICKKCLARMKGCWDPEFEPSAEEIMDG